MPIRNVEAATGSTSFTNSALACRCPAPLPPLPCLALHPSFLPPAQPPTFAILSFASPPSLVDQFPWLIIVSNIFGLLFQASLQISTGKAKFDAVRFGVNKLKFCLFVRHNFNISNLGHLKEDDTNNANYNDKDKYKERYKIRKGRVL